MKSKSFFGFDITPRSEYRAEISLLQEELKVQAGRIDSLSEQNMELSGKLRRAMEVIHSLEAKLATYDRKRGEKGRFVKTKDEK